MKTGHFALAMLLALGMSAITVAQDNSQAGEQPSSTDALAAAARRVRQDRKDQPKAAKVYTNDNLPTNATISFVGSEAGAPAKAANASAAAAAKTPAPAADQNAQTAATPSLQQAAKMTPEQKKAEDEAALATAKQQLESAKKDLDLEKRKFALDQQTYMSNPNHDSDKTGAAALQTEQDDIAAKQDEVDAAQRVVNDLETRLGISATAADSSGGGSSSDSHPF